MEAKIKEKKIYEVKKSRRRQKSMRKTKISKETKINKKKKVIGRQNSNRKSGISMVQIDGSKKTG